MSMKLPKAVIEAQEAVKKHESEMASAPTPQPAPQPTEQAPVAQPQAQPMSELVKMEQKLKSFEGRINRVNADNAALEQRLKDKDAMIDKLQAMLREQTEALKKPASVLLEEEKVVLGNELEAPLARIREQQMKDLAELEKRYEQRLGNIEKQTEEYKNQLYRERLQSIIPNIFEINNSEACRAWLLKLVPGSNQTNDDVIVAFDRARNVEGVVSKFREFLSTPEGREFAGSEPVTPTNPREHIQPRVIEANFDSEPKGPRPTKEGYAEYVKRVTQGFYTRRPDAYAKDKQFWDAAIAAGVLN